MNQFDDKIHNSLKKLTIKIKERKNIKSPGLFYIKQSDLSNYVTHRLKSLEPYFLEILEIKSFESVNHVSQSSFYTFGLIINLNDGKLRPDAVYIINTLDKSNSTLVKLNLKYCSKYSIYQGMVVAVRGKNPGGNEILVEQIESIPTCNLNFAVATSNLTVITANGPYLSNHFLEGLVEQHADVLILHGPFANSQSEFRNEVMPKLKGWLRKSMSSTIILIPSLNDPLSMNVLPQAPFLINEDRILSFSNPSMFFINNYLFATASYDVFMDLSGEECFSTNNIENDSGNSAKILFKDDRITRLCQHLIFQGTFIPVFPSSSPVSISNPAHFDIETVPDIFILSSKMQPFCKQTELSTIINHGSQQKIENKVYAKLVLKGSKDYDCSFHSVADGTNKGS